MPDKAYKILVTLSTLIIIITGAYLIISQRVVPTYKATLQTKHQNHDIDKKYQQLVHDLQNKIAQSPIKTEIGIYDATSNKTWILHSSKEEEPHQMASTIKVSILANELRLHKTLSDQTSVWANNMITHSDNDSATALLTDQGGYAAPNELFKDLGMSHSQMNTSAWGISTSTASDQLILLKNIFYTSGTLTNSMRTTIKTLMGQVEDDQQWGVPTGAGDDFQVKNGWLNNEDGTWIVNSLGHIKSEHHDYVVALLSDNNSSFEAGINYLNSMAKVINTSLK